MSYGRDHLPCVRTMVYHMAAGGAHLWNMETESRVICVCICLIRCVGYCVWVGPSKSPQPEEHMFRKPVNPILPIPKPLFFITRSWIVCGSTARGAPLRIRIIRGRLSCMARRVH